MTYDETELDELIAAAAREDERAWQDLWAWIEPPLSRIVAQPRFLGRLGQRQDDRRNIIVAVMARLRAARFHRLQLFLEAKRQNPGLKFLSWLRVVAKRVGIDYMRTLPEYMRAEVAWVNPGTLPPSSQLGDRPPVTSRGTAHELLAYAEGALPADQHRALQMWAASASWSDIARELALPDDASAERLVRAAVERLRRRFRE